MSCSFHVYVADVNTPYRPYLVADSDYEFSIVQWDPCGTQILLCDVRGCVSIYQSNDYLISDWQLIFKQTFAAEVFITASWYHPGIVTKINVANQNLKNPSNHLEYTDKIQKSKFGASLRLFGGKAAEGCIVVSRTGLICCLTRLRDGGNFKVLCDSLGLLRGRVMVADICHDQDGSFIVATSSGPINSTIAFYQIFLTAKNLTLDDVDLHQLNIENRRISITCKPFASFHLNVLSQISGERESSTPPFERVGHIKFVNKDSPSEVLIEVKGQNLSLIELWELETVKQPPVNSLIIDIIKSNEDVKPKIEINNVDTPTETELSAAIGQSNQGVISMHWSFKGNYITEKDLVAIQTPGSRLFSSIRQLNLVLLAYSDFTISCLRKEDLAPMFEPLDLSEAITSIVRHKNGRNTDDVSRFKVCQGNRSYSATGRLASNNIEKPPPKKFIYITDIQFSTNQTLFFVIDSLSQIHAIRLPPLIPCQDDQDLETYVQYVLEYCLVTGNDWWDVLVYAGQISVEGICDRIHDAFERQPKHLQVSFYNRQLTIRASLYQCIGDIGSLCKASDCHTLITLNYISNSLKSLLRSYDQDYATEDLTNLLKTQGNQPNFLNCDNVISKINEKEFHVETNVIQCLQPLIQWVTDLAIYLIVSKPQKHATRVQLPGAGLAEDKDALEALRELMVIIKIWGQQNGASLPNVIKLNDQIDVISTLYRLISIMHNSLGNEPEESLSDECAKLSHNISIPEFSFILNCIGVLSLISQQNIKQERSTIILEYLKEPALTEHPKLPKIEGAVNMNGNRRIDVVRNISLGAHPTSNLRLCSRCQSVSLIKPTFNSIRTWEQRWIRQCVCGGSWAQSDGSYDSKLTWLRQKPAIGSLNHTHQMVR